MVLRFLDFIVQRIDSVCYFRGYDKESGLVITKEVLSFLRIIVLVMVEVLSIEYRGCVFM